MECKNCQKELSVELGTRPVLLCRHLLCDTCAGELKCPICGAIVDGSLDEYIDSDILKSLSELKESKEKLLQSSSMYFSCRNHPSKQIQFLCKKDISLMCSECAWSHIRDHKDLVLPYDEQMFNNDLSEMKAVFDNFKNDLMSVEKSLDTIRNYTPNSEDFNEVLASAGAILRSIDRQRDHNMLCYTAKAQKSPEKLYMTIREQHMKEVDAAYKATRDGQSIERFRALCANKGPSVLVITVRGIKFGAYLHESWLNNDKVIVGSSKSFMFHWSEPELKLPWKKGEGHENGYENNFLRVGDDITICKQFLFKAESYVSPGEHYGAGDELNKDFRRRFGDKKFKVDELAVYLLSD